MTEFLELSHQLYNLIPRTFSTFEIADRETLGQGC